MSPVQINKKETVINNKNAAPVVVIQASSVWERFVEGLSGAKKTPQQDAAPGVRIAWNLIDGRLVQLLADEHDLSAQLVVLFHEIVDFIATVHHRGVVTATHGVADFRKGGIGFLPD